MADGSPDLGQAPYFGDLAEAPKGHASWLTASDGVRVRVVEWPRKDARGTVVIYTGRTEFGEKYGRLSRDFAGHGLASVAIDWRGQGLSDRVHPNKDAGHVGQFLDYQKDAQAVWAHLEAQNYPKPWILLAHSMGGCIGLRSLMGDHPFTAAAFSAPMWGIYFGPALEPFARVMAAVGTKIGLGNAFPPGQKGKNYFEENGFNDNTLTTDREFYEHMKRMAEAKPELMIGGPTFNWVREAVRETDNLHRMGSPNIQTVTFLGTDEVIVDPRRIKSRMERWPNGTLHMEPGLRHEVLMESPDRRLPMVGKIASLV